MASLESGVAISPKTRMRIGSTSKHFAALLALLLQEEGKFDLDLPIRTFLPELVGPSGDPTARQLLRHRGGGRCYLDLQFIAHGMTPPPPGTSYETLCRQAGRNFPPGAAMIYNNGGYHLLSRALDRAGGAPYETQLKERLFDPVGMPDTISAPSDHDIIPGAATLHVPNPTGPGWRRGLFPTEDVRGEGAIVSTVDDMLRWAAHLRTRNRFGSPDTWSQLVELPREADGTTGRYALGLRHDLYRGLPTVHHAGGVIGGLSQMLTFPSHGLDVVILANGARAANPVELALKVADIILGEELGPALPSLTATGYEALVGNWWSPETGMIYGFGEQAGHFGLSICSLDIVAPLSRDADGALLCSSTGLGDIIIDPATAEAPAGLSIRFAGVSERYVRLVQNDAAMSDRWLGRYRSADAGCDANIAWDSKRLLLSCQSPFGRAVSALTVLHQRAAISVSTMPGLPFSSALTLDDDGGGFWMNTSRTRHLRFERV